MTPFHTRRATERSFMRRQTPISEGIRCGPSEWDKIYKATNSAVGTVWDLSTFNEETDIFIMLICDASNYAVGVYMAGAGYSYFETLAVGTGYSLRHSSNWESGFAYHIKWWTKGWD